MEHSTINDLPSEVLEMIFDGLDVDDLKNASMVCTRWSNLAFLGRRIDSVLLVATFPLDKDLLLSNRKYRHLELGETDKYFAHVKELFQAFNFTSLRIKNEHLSHSSLRSILLEVPSLQHLSIYHEPHEMDEMSEPLPVMRKLERLEISYGNRKSALPWHTIAPSLHGLKMCCDSEEQLEQCRLFSDKLKQIDATFHVADLLKLFCEITFPLLEELSIRSFSGCGALLGVSHQCFRRNAALRRLCLDGIYISKTLVQDITNHNKKLSSLKIINIRQECAGEQGSLESLAHLTELKHLRLDNLNGCIFRGCKALTSLQSLRIDRTCLDKHEEPLRFLENLLKIAPQLRSLELGSVVMPARAVDFICNKFTKLSRLQLTWSEAVTSDGLSGIDRLPHLRYLELMLIDTNKFFISIIPKNGVRYLTLHLDYKYHEDDLLRLPETFPLLDRLNLINGYLRESTVNRLRQLLPTCVIKIYGQLITNAGMKRFARKCTRSEMMPVWEKEWVW